MAAPVLKKKVDVELLVQWAYLDELSKRHTSSAEGIWDRLAQNGSLGGINPDPGHGSAQRYAHFGLPHPDAETIEKAVGRLHSVAIDWKKNFKVIAGDLAALISVNDVERRDDLGERTTTSGWLDKKSGDIKRVVNKPRDVLLLNTITTAALVTMYAVRKGRPDWRTEQMRPVRTVATRGSPDAVKIIGKCRGKNFYTTGSYCPLIWEPSPIEVALARADYVAWHQGLTILSQTLQLTEHVALPPAASPTPWIEEEREIPRRTFKQPHGDAKVLPLHPRRERRSLPPKKSKHSKGRSLLVD